MFSAYIFAAAGFLAEAFVAAAPLVAYGNANKYKPVNRSKASGSSGE
jgi:hypothetical protein